MTCPVRNLSSGHLERLHSIESLFLIHTVFLSVTEKCVLLTSITAMLMVIVPFSSANIYFTCVTAVLLGTHNLGLVRMSIEHFVLSARDVPLTLESTWLDTNRSATAFCGLVFVCVAYYSAVVHIQPASFYLKCVFYKHIGCFSSSVANFVF